jgi:cytochrome P450
VAFFDPTRPAYRADPYPSLARLRRDEPVHWSTNLRAWVLTRYDDCAAALHDSARFTTDPARTTGARAEAIVAHRAAAPLGDVPHLGTTSGEPHRALRHIVNPVFSTEASRASQPEIDAHIAGLLDGIERGVPVEFVRAVANPLPRKVLARFLGFPNDDTDRWQRLFATIEVARSNAAAPVSVSTLAENARGELASLMETATFAPGSVLGALTASGEMSPDARISVAAHIATVGADPTTGGIANSVAALAAHPGAFSALREDPGLIGAAVHELLRFDSPTHIAPRFAAADTELGGRRIRRGDSVLAVVGAANRDPAAFEDPDTLDLARDARRQLAFGQGEHICLGMPLALLILERLIRALVERFESLEFLGPPEFGPTVELRIPDKLALTFR